MKEYPPKNVFNKNFEFNYLYSDSDIVGNDEFANKLFDFVKTLKSNFLVFEILSPERYNNLFEKKIIIDEITAQKIIDTFDYKSNCDSELYPLFVFSFYIYDSTEKWKIYASKDYEIAIFGCDKSINSLLEILFKPYEEESLEQKLSWVTDRFTLKADKIFYIKELEKNYCFSK